MGSQKHRKLDAIVARLQLDYGPRAIRRAGPDEVAPPVPRIATSFNELDAVLDGGVPQGRITEFTGPPTSGKLTMAAKAIATAHQMDKEVLAAWIDPSYTCDPDYMQRCGVDLNRLLVVHPATGNDALAVLLHLAQSNTLALLVFDGLPPEEPAPGSPDALGSRVNPGGEGAFAGALSRLSTVLAETATAAVFLTESDGQSREPVSRALAHAASLRITIRREQWITRNGDVRGYTGQAEIVKNRLGSAGMRVPVRILFNGTVRGDGL